jgi:hypothetical protein
MIKILSFIFGVIFLGFLVYVLFGHIPKSDAKAFLCLVYAAILFVWLGCLITDMVSEVNKQYKDFYSIEEYERQKESYNIEMDQYVLATKDELLQNFRDFEEGLMTKVSDSKLIATVLKENGYAKSLGTYETRIKSYLHDIHTCDRQRERTRRDMLVRQTDYISGYAFLIPASIKI